MIVVGCINRIVRFCGSFFVIVSGLLLFSCSPGVRTVGPTKGQQAMIDRKYGMFLHYGMNTYLDAEWSDGSDSAGIYAPPADIAGKAAGWVKTAKEAGMRSVVLITKHHDGFCLWDSKYTDYDVANPGVRNQADIVKAVSDACRENGIAFSIYYSLWDRHEPVYRDKDKGVYIRYMKNQLEELMTNYGTVSELWFDGGWDRKLEDWHLQEVYDFVKGMQPDCQISTNWTLGKRPVDMREGDSIVYFPADFRLWDPYLPVENDPKIYTYKGQQYYLPFESTQTISVLGNWFNHASDTTVRELDELEEIFYVATSNDNCLLLNIPPDKDGNMNPKAVGRIKELARVLSIENGKDFPKVLKKPRSLTSSATAEASSVYKSDSVHCGAGYAVDSDVSTSWKCADSTGWLIITLPERGKFQRIAVIEEGNNIKEFTVEVEKDGQWNVVHRGEALSDESAGSFMGYGYGEVCLPQPEETQRIRFNIQKAAGTPGIYSIRLK